MLLAVKSSLAFHMKCSIQDPREATTVSQNSTDTFAMPCHAMLYLQIKRPKATPTPLLNSHTQSCPVKNVAIT